MSAVLENLSPFEPMALIFIDVWVYWQVRMRDGDLEGQGN